LARALHARKGVGCMAASSPCSTERGTAMAINWMVDVEAARAQARQERRLVFIDIWSKT
jgi:hypothetical protein